MISGIDNKNLLIINFCESFTTQPPANRLIDIKCIQKSIRKRLFENKLDRLEILKYNPKLVRKS